MSSKTFHYDTAEKEYIDCNCCGSRHTKTIFTKDRYSMGINTVICQNCGLVFTNPVLTDKELDDFYGFHYRNYYVSTEYPDEAYLKMRKLQERADILLAHVKDRLPLRLRLLDIGASEGTVLHTLRSYCRDDGRYEAPVFVGVEPNQKFAHYAIQEHGLKIFNGMVGDFLDANTDTFNFIILNHVLEHFKDPSAVLAKLWELLEEDGYVFIEVPNLEYKNPDISFFHIAHIYHFTPCTLEQLALKAGFIPVYKKLSSSTIHPWAMAYVFQKIDKKNLSISVTDTYVDFIQKHVRRVYPNIWKNRMLYPWRFMKKTVYRLGRAIR